MNAPTEAEKQDLIDVGLAADRLRTDPAFQRAIVQMRKEAVDQLIETPVSDIENNTRLRAEIKAIDALCGQIAIAIQRGSAVSQRTA